MYRNFKILNLANSLSKIVKFYQFISMSIFKILKVFKYLRIHLRNFENK